jgi:hypothetical protein
MNAPTSICGERFKLIGDSAALQMEIQNEHIFRPACPESVAWDFRAEAWSRSIRSAVALVEHFSVRPVPP